MARTGLALLGLTEVAAAALALLALLTPASAQIDDRFPFLEDRRRRNQQNQPYQQPQWGGPFGFEQPRQQPVDSSRAPPPRRADATPTTKIMVFGNSMADWLAFGLEEAFADTPEIGVLRKHRTSSGLIRVEVRGESYDWPNAARDLLNAEKPDYIVMIIGVADRRGIREAIGNSRRERRPARSSSQPSNRRPQLSPLQRRKRPRSSRPQRHPPRPRRSRRTPKHRRKARRRTPRRTAINQTSSRPKPRSPERWCTSSAPRSGANSIHAASMK